MQNTIRWGILGTGWIARKFAEGLAQLPDAQLTAVGSRTTASAEAFGAKFRVPRCHGSYVALANDPQVDVIHVATPHPFHAEHSLLALEAGKAVLCEKPFSINEAEARVVVRAARERRLFLMEAMWVRFVPAMKMLLQLVRDGAIGEVRIVIAGLCYEPGTEPRPRLYDLNLGGGALLDLGVYPVSLTSMVLGEPKSIKSEVHFDEAGVDERSAILMRHDQDKLAVLHAAMRTNTPRELVVAGTRGWVRAPIIRPTQVTLLSPNTGEQIIEVPTEGNGYNYEASEVMRCLREGKLESETMTLDETVQIMKTLDEIRSQWGLKYPTEESR